MKALRSSVLVALIVVSAAVVVASPAFATPQLTASSGNDTPLVGAHSRAAVAPFITPSTSTRSQYTARADRATTLNLAAIGFVISCTASRASIYVSVTHTQARVTDLTFSGTCTTNFAGSRVDTNPISCVTDSNRPWYLHVRTAGNPDSTGSVNINGSCRLVVTFGGGSSATITIDANQSCTRGIPANGVVFTQVTQSLAVNCDLRVTIVGGPLPGSFTGNFTGLYTVRPDTARDARITVTARS
jgi:hypothetical protein